MTAKFLRIMFTGIWLLILPGFVSANDSITIYNKTDTQWYAGMYYVDKTAQMYGGVVAIPANGEAQITRPERKSESKLNPFAFYDRNIYFSDDEADVKQVLDQTEVQSLKGLNVGTTSLLGTNKLYLKANEHGALGVYRSIEMTGAPLISVAKKTAESAEDLLLAPLRAAFKNSEYADKKASVTLRSGQLSQDEKEYIEKRRVSVKAAIEKLLGKQISDKQVPCIALCCSGGGYRAMNATIGDFVGLQETGLMDTTTYMIGLSGSTWAIAGWVTSGLSIAEYRDQLSKRISEDLFHGDIDAGQVAAALLRKKAFGQPISIIDLYGALLGQKLLKGLGGFNSPNDINLTQQIDRIKNASLAYPIYTSIIAPDRVADPYEWVEYVPYEVGSEYLGAYVPAWGMGQKFANGQSQQAAPPQPLGYFMGIWGSAFSANLKVMLDDYMAKLPKTAAALLQSAMSDETVGDTRVSPAHMWNITYNINGKPLQQKAKLTLIDAGLDFNNPLPPLMRPERKVDIIIVFDQSKTVVGAPELEKADKYFAKRGIAFPEIDYAKASNTISVHKDPAGKTPIIVYMPRVGDDANLPDFKEIAGNVGAWSFIDTTNFAYTADQVMKLSNLTRDNVVRSKNALIKVIDEVVASKA